MRLKPRNPGKISSRSSFSSRRIPVNNNSITSTKSKIPAILVSRQQGGIGDMMMLTPTFRQIKKDNPDIPLIVCTTPIYGGNRGVLFDILKNNPHIDKVVGVNELVNYSFTKVYNFGTGEENFIEISRKHPTGNRIDIFSEIGGVKLEDKSTVYVVTDKEKEWATDWINSKVDPNRRTIIGIQVRSSSSRRDWPLDKVLLLAFRIVNTWPNTSVLLFYEGIIEESNENYTNIINVVGLPIRWVAALLNEGDLLIVPDSGLLHIGGALHKKMITLFGSIPPSARIGYYPEATAVTINNCEYCWYSQCTKQYKCITEIPINDVMEKISTLLEFQEKKLTGTVLIIRMGGIGDLIMLSASIRELKNKYSIDKMILATNRKNIDVLRGLPYLDAVVSIEEIPKLQDINSTIDLRYRVESPEVGGNLNTELYKTVNRIDMFSKLMHVYPLSDKKVDVSVRKSVVTNIKKILGYEKKSKWIGIQATCTSNTRTFPPEYIDEIVKRLSSIEKIKIVLFGRTEFWNGCTSSTDLSKIKGERIINFMNKISSVSEMIALISLMDYIIAPDSSAVHIAAALEKPCLAVFGNIDPYLRTHYYKTVTSLFPTGELDCIPCHDFINPCMHYTTLIDKNHPIGGKCMRLLTPDIIVEKAKTVFGL